MIRSRERLCKALLAAAAATFAGMAGPASAEAPAGLRPPLALTVDQLIGWSPKGALADRRNVSHVKLARRIVDPGPGPDPHAKLDRSARVLIAPDGMNDLGSYLAPQAAFNLYTFTHWAQVDVLAWFGGTARESVVIPARPWIDAAHRNGVKVIGTVFFPTTHWGGSPETVRSFLLKDARGHFPAADRLVAIARLYGFDGWLINEETEVPAADGRRMRTFMAYLTRIAPAPMEIHWYDAMLPDGHVGWQNAFNRHNVRMFQDGRTRVADALFLNYDWSSKGLRQGRALARSLGRDPYSIFIGADLWPQRSGAQGAVANRHWLRDLRANGDRHAFGSIALFAPNFNFNGGGQFGRFDRDPRDVDKFYDGEVRLFAGDDRNMAAGNSAEAAHAGEWEGIAALIPARSTLSRLPFQTSFNTGHGLHEARDGRLVGGPWHDMSRQDVLPSWQFAYTPSSGVEIGFDFDKPFNGGSSLRVSPRLSQRRIIMIPLYVTDLRLGRRTRVEVTTRTEARGYSLNLRMSDGSVARLLLHPGNGWQRQSRCLRFHGKRIKRISIEADPSSGAAKPLNLGMIRIDAGCRSTEHKRTRQVIRR